MRRWNYFVFCIASALAIYSHALQAQTLLWQQPANPLQSEWWSNIAVDSNEVLINTLGNTGGLWRTHLNGGGWSLLRRATFDVYYYRVSACQGMYVLGGRFGYVSKSTDRGRTWTQERVYGATSPEIFFVGSTPTFNAALANDNSIAEIGRAHV